MLSNTRQYLINFQYSLNFCYTTTREQFISIKQRNHLLSMIKQKFKEIELLGEGSFGTVTLVEFQNKQLYALKEVKVDPFFIEQALKQIDILEKIQHQSIVRVYDTEYDGTDSLKILMEYCQEGDLLTYIRNKGEKLDTQTIMRVLRQIVQAFIIMNNRGIIHRDLKPENILIAKGEIIKVADFGCATHIKQSFLSKLQFMSYDKGTPNYSSPQQLLGLPYSSRCDVWAFGCLVYFLYFGEHPFAQVTIENTITKIRSLTQNKTFMMAEIKDLVFQKLMKICLVFEDRQRATWRQISLSRIFAPKITNIEDYLKYTCLITNIANWITKQFWRIRKNMKINEQKNSIFAYFMIKYQYTNMKLAKSVINKEKEIAYLFLEDAYRYYCPSKEFQAEIMADYKGSKSYFLESKNCFEKKNYYNLIKLKQKDTESTFGDLDNSIKICYKILTEIIGQLKEKAQQRAESCVIDPVWVIMSRWINFQVFFSFESNPQFYDFFKPINDNEAFDEISQNIEKFENGVIS